MTDEKLNEKFETVLHLVNTHALDLNGFIKANYQILKQYNKTEFKNKKFDYCIYKPKGVGKLMEKVGTAAKLAGYNITFFDDNNTTAISGNYCLLNNSTVYNCVYVVYPDMIYPVEEKN